MFVRYFNQHAGGLHLAIGESGRSIVCASVWPNMASTNLVVPVVLWGPYEPTHCVSSVFLSRDLKTLATGCYDGQICLWWVSSNAPYDNYFLRRMCPCQCDYSMCYRKVDPDTLKMTPRCLLVGHTAPVLCLSRASIIQDNNFLISSSENGEMCTWDLVDGKCKENTKLLQVHTSIQVMKSRLSNTRCAYCQMLIE